VKSSASFTHSKKITVHKKQQKIEKMIGLLDAIIEEVLATEKKAEQKLLAIHPAYQKSACNLLHYRVLRSHDLRDLQNQLGNMGLSRLAKSQSHVMASLLTNRAILIAMLGHSPFKKVASELSFKKGNSTLRANAKKLLGYRSKSRRTRIMVTMPGEVAYDYAAVLDMMKAGMNCARINCAHDNPGTWKKIIGHVRKASHELGRKCKVAMDLAGPKIRTGEMTEGPRVRKIRPVKDEYGRIAEPVKIWLGPDPKPDSVHVPVSQAGVDGLPLSGRLYFRDTRGKKRNFVLTGKEGTGFNAQCGKTTFIEQGMPLFVDKKMESKPVYIGELPPVEIVILLKKGDLLRLDAEPLLGEPAHYGEQGELLAKPHISCTAPTVFEQVKTGQRILFDDGKIEGVVRKNTGESMVIEVVHASGGTAKLRSEKGINLPDTKLTISGLTAKDREDLPFVAEHADVVNFSFVNRPQDVRELLGELDKLGAKDKLGIILKIETKSGYDQLTEILLEAMHVCPIGVMIARGDLAIETGWDNIGRVQEEILSLCQAAHVTDIWATQVLEGLAKNGIPSRSEITDAVMAQRADCVMLNKGPFIVQAIQLLDSILADMEPYWEKNAPLSPVMERADKHHLSVQ